MTIQQRDAVLALLGESNAALSRVVDALTRENGPTHHALCELVAELAAQMIGTNNQVGFLFRDLPVDTVPKPAPGPGYDEFGKLTERS